MDHISTKNESDPEVVEAYFKKLWKRVTTQR